MLNQETKRFVSEMGGFLQCLFSTMEGRLRFAGIELGFKKSLCVLIPPVSVANESSRLLRGLEKSGGTKVSFDRYSYEDRLQNTMRACSRKFERVAYPKMPPKGVFLF